MNRANIRCILHPTDFSEGSSCAFEMARSLARDYGARLLVLHVLPPPVTAAFAGEGMVAVSDRHEGDLRDAEEQLGKLQAASPDVRVEQATEQGDPGEVILKVADREDCDLIVMGTQGRTGLARILLGSVAEHVMRHARCPMLAVKPPAAPGD